MLRSALIFKYIRCQVSNKLAVRDASGRGGLFNIFKNSLLSISLAIRALSFSFGFCASLTALNKATTPRVAIFFNSVLVSQFMTIEDKEMPVKKIIRVSRFLTADSSASKLFRCHKRILVIDNGSRCQRLVKLSRLQSLTARSSSNFRDFSL